ncbi:uncharacterized protein LOC105695301 [Orussus abietinus]|uniref:uncharacterized protein LOC105695301 n=1 Tax=Orussus abietinus TaxID=222816 RepID=UPI00062613AE|nr:uncharacterized protein LOC105695301 [Orussus abietinus]
MFNQIIRPVIRYGAVRGARFYHDPNFKPVTMDDLPVPQGSWQKDYEAKQKRYNIHLAVGIASLIFTIAFAKQSGLVYLNAFPPSEDDK